MKKRINLHITVLEERYLFLFFLLSVSVKNGTRGGLNNQSAARKNTRPFVRFFLHEVRVFLFLQNAVYFFVAFAKLKRTAGISGCP